MSWYDSLVNLMKPLFGYLKYVDKYYIWIIIGAIILAFLIITRGV